MYMLVNLTHRVYDFCPAQCFADVRVSTSVFLAEFLGR